jgi:heterodisulfide reductase subunit A-like polyferredoxin
VTRIEEPARQIPVMAETEVLVVGGGPAGLAAARHGAQVSHAAPRQMMGCTVTGQGAGVASAVSLETGVTPPQVDVAGVQAALRQQGVRLE